MVSRTRTTVKYTFTLFPSQLRFTLATPARDGPDAKSPQALSRPPAHRFPSNFASPSQEWRKYTLEDACVSELDYDPDEGSAESSGMLYDPSQPEPGIAPLSDVISQIAIIGL